MIAHNDYSSHILSRLDIYLDGIQLKDALWADDEVGEVWVTACDAKGRSIPAIMALDGDVKSDKCVVVLLRGKVEIRIAEPMTEEELTVDEIKRVLDYPGMTFSIQLEWPRDRGLLRTILAMPPIPYPLVDGQIRLPRILNDTAR